MNKTIAVLCLTALSLAAQATTYQDPREVYASLYQPYFESLQLYYETPRGCNEQKIDGRQSPPTCAIAADFNGDGVFDYAGLIEYTGGDLRSGNRYLDLVVLYSGADGAPRHKIYSRLGAVSDRGEIDHYLEIQPVGEVKLPAGPEVLERPSINVIGMHDAPVLVRFWGFNTYYWAGSRFVRLNKDSD